MTFRPLKSCMFISSSPGWGISSIYIKISSLDAPSVHAQTNQPDNWPGGGGVLSPVRVGDPGAEKLKLYLYKGCGTLLFMLYKDIT